MAIPIETLCTHFYDLQIQTPSPKELFFQKLRTGGNFVNDIIELENLIHTVSASELLQCLVVLVAREHSPGTSAYHEALAMSLYTIVNHFFDHRVSKHAHTYEALEDDIPWFDAIAASFRSDMPKDKIMQQCFRTLPIFTGEKEREKLARAVHSESACYLYIQMPRPMGELICAYLLCKRLGELVSPDDARIKDYQDKYIRLLRTNPIELQFRAGAVFCMFMALIDARRELHASLKAGPGRLAERAASIDVAAFYEQAKAHEEQRVSKSLATQFIQLCKENEEMTPEQLFCHPYVVHFIFTHFPDHASIGYLCAQSTLVGQIGFDWLQHLDAKHWPSLENYCKVASVSSYWLALSIPSVAPEGRLKFLNDRFSALLMKVIDCRDAAKIFYHLAILHPGENIHPRVQRAFSTAVNHLSLVDWKIPLVDITSQAGEDGLLNIYKEIFQSLAAIEKKSGLCLQITFCQKIRSISPQYASRGILSHFRSERVLREASTKANRWLSGLSFTEDTAVPGSQ